MVYPVKLGPIGVKKQPFITSTTTFLGGTFYIGITVGLIIFQWRIYPPKKDVFISTYPFPRLTRIRV